MWSLDTSPCKALWNETVQFNFGSTFFITVMWLTFVNHFAPEYLKVWSYWKRIWGREAATTGAFYSNLLFTIFTGKHLCCSFSGLKVCHFIKKRLQHRCFPVNVAKYLGRPISKNIKERLLLQFGKFFYTTLLVLLCYKPLIKTLFITALSD